MKFRSRVNSVVRMTSLAWARCALIFTILGLGGATLQAQWRTQDFELKIGWNAVYLHVDPSFTSIEDFVDGTPIKEVWLWAPVPSSIQFIESPQEPVSDGASWIQWNKDDADPDLKNLIGNAAYLINVTETYFDDDNVEQTIAEGETIPWSVIGEPMPPVYDWSADGQNFLGFQIPPDASDLVFDTFFSPIPELQDLAVLYQYDGGDIETNPVARSATDVELNRGEGYWVRAAGLYNDYFGPFQLTLQDYSGVHLGDSVAQYRLRLKNVVDSDLTVTMSLAESDDVPDWDGIVETLEPILGMPPVLVRDAIDLTTLTYTYTDLNAEGSIEFPLAPAGESGSEVEVILGVNRATMSGDPGDFYAAILQFTDSLGYLEVEVPISATVASLNGLWVGEAEVDRVRHDLTFFERNDEGTIFDDDGNPTVLSSDVSFGSVARSYSMRLIVHMDEEGTARLMQRIFYGRDKDNELAEILATVESALHGDHLDTARRLSTAHLPWSLENDSWELVGNFGLNEIDFSGINLDFAEIESEDELPENTPDHLSKVFLGDFGDDLVVRIFDANGDVVADESFTVTTASGGELSDLNTTAESLVGTTPSGYTLLNALEQTEALLTLSDSLINYSGYEVRLASLTSTDEAPTAADGLASIVYFGDVASELLLRVFDDTGAIIVDELFDLDASPSNEVVSLNTLAETVIGNGTVTDEESYDLLILAESVSSVDVVLANTTDFEVVAQTITGEAEIPVDTLEYTDLLFVGSLDGTLHLRVIDENGLIVLESSSFLLETAGGDLDELSALLETALGLGTITASEETEIIEAAATLLSRAQVVTQVEVPWSDQAANPFVHTYHPDHDNRDAEFNSAPLDIGYESYQLIRDIGMLFTVPSDDFDSLTTGMERLSGDYAEEVTIVGKEVEESGGGSHFEKNTYGAQGEFVLRRISKLDDLQFE